MSRVRGVFPLFLATTFGIVNGIWVFGPAFKEQQEREEEARKDLVVSPEVNNAQVEEVRATEAAPSRAVATESVLKPVENSSSWWTKLDVWNRGPPKGTNGNTTKELESAGGSKETKG
ncbi:uncharacterized protein PAC_02663 [Phialocephala subalpina]|uniref:Uncharacterized protein n=1 Tax=Phialocephala subalpina TaxID=576137 RepID=A0A1L7WJ53_9HELO|nr:uncharacterized protein PAC_02663 [Phialocephala subalpina]